MFLGAVAILDALGFKGIWEREDPRAILDLLKSLKRHGLELQGSDYSGCLVDEPGFRHRVRFMSDTIVITVVIKERKSPIRPLYKALYSATMIAGDIMVSALHNLPPLLFRGCVAAGNIIEDSDFLIGPAVDEAAESFEKADGPFLWLTTSALDISHQYADTFHDRLEPIIMIPYRVPMNDGKRFNTHAFTYFSIGDDEERRTWTRSSILQAFRTSSKPSVVNKKRNTAAFLNKVDAYANSGKWKYYRPTRMPQWQDLTFSQRVSLINHNIFPKDFH